MKSQNPNLEIARINKDLSELDIKAYRSNYYPKVNLLGGYQHSKNNFPPGFSFTQNTTRNGLLYGFGISWNIFNGTYVSPNLQSARIEFINQDYRYNENELLLSSQLYESYRDYEANISLVRLETDNLELARENVNIALEQYQLGVINDIDLRAIQLKQIESETNLLVSQFRAKQSEIELKLISGSLTVSD
ncbi:MAG: TolC family protein [Bacteroidetes bacterium]|nr:TolC family protein [Bacteroidota bacterium]